MLTLPWCGRHFHISPACLHATPAPSDKHRFQVSWHANENSFPRIEFWRTTLFSKHSSRIIPILQHLCAALLTTLTILVLTLREDCIQIFRPLFLPVKWKITLSRILVIQSGNYFYGTPPVSWGFDVSGQGFKLSSWISSSKPPILEYKLTPPPHSLQETPISLPSCYQESYNSLWLVQPTRVAYLTLQRR